MTLKLFLKHVWSFWNITNEHYFNADAIFAKIGFLFNWKTNRTMRKDVTENYPSSHLFDTIRSPETLKSKISKHLSVFAAKRCYLHNRLLISRISKKKWTSSNAQKLFFMSIKMHFLQLEFMKKISWIVDKKEQEFEKRTLFSLSLSYGKLEWKNLENSSFFQIHIFQKNFISKLSNCMHDSKWKVNIIISNAVWSFV